jgi:hypothetical protein
LLAPVFANEALGSLADGGVLQDVRSAVTPNKAIKDLESHIEPLRWNDECIFEERP